MGLKRKGGWEREKIKKQKLLKAEGEKCLKITDLFLSNAISISISDSGPSTSTFPCAIKEETIKNDIETHISEKPNMDSTSDSSNIEKSQQQLDSSDTENENEGTPEDQEDQDQDQEDQEEDLEDEKHNYFLKPETNLLSQYFIYHPIQPNLQATYKLNQQKLFFREDGVRRSWLSFDEKNSKFFCTFCLAFSKNSQESIFKTGYAICKSKHIYQRITEHESSWLHNNCSEAYVLTINDKNVLSLLNKKRLQQSNKNREILKRIIETIKVIGKRGLSYRGLHESAKTLLDLNLDHGNFLELILLISKFDPILKFHIEDAVKNSNLSKGRGNFITFLSKTTVNHIIDIIHSVIKETISKEIKESEMYSIQIDTTQDINAEDQCSIILRYVNDRVYERLISITNCTSTTGEDLCKLVSNVLNELGIDVSKCIGNCTDGAGNMQGKYKGFSAWLNKISPNQIHTWCYAHKLNLVITEITQTTTEAISLFGLLNTCAIFVRESYKRMNVWKEYSKFKFISAIGETRWWAKDVILRKVFGDYNSANVSIYIDIIQTCHDISTSNKFNKDIRHKAKTILDGFLKFDLILTAHIFLNIFKETTPLSLYLQTNNMNIITAFNMIKTTHKHLLNISRKFEEVYDTTIKFVTTANEELINRNLDICISLNLSSNKRNTDIDVKDRFRINVYNLTMDNVIASLQDRFLENDDLYKDIYYLDPTNFDKAANNGLPNNAFKKIVDIINKKFDKKICHVEVQSELKDFAKKWTTFQQITDEREEYLSEEGEVNPEDESRVKIKCQSCNNCIICCYMILQKFNLHTLAYSNLFLIYKFVATLSSTQVSCERTFSKLKYILNRLRNCLSQNKLEAFLLMSCEKDVLNNIPNDKIIDIMKDRSKLYNKLL